MYTKVKKFSRPVFETQPGSVKLALALTWFVSQSNVEVQSVIQIISIGVHFLMTGTTAICFCPSNSSSAEANLENIL